MRKKNKKPAKKAFRKKIQKINVRKNKKPIGEGKKRKSSQDDKSRKKRR